jgi:hypothetical protein
MKKIILLLTLPITFLVKAQEKPKLKMEIRSNTRDISIPHVNNEHKLERIEFNKEKREERRQVKLEKLHTRPHFDKQREKREMRIQQDQKRELIRERRQTRQEKLQR